MALAKASGRGGGAGGETAQGLIHSDSDRYALFFDWLKFGVLVSFRFQKFSTVSF